MVFRFDDVSINTDVDNLVGLVEVINRHTKPDQIIFAVSPIVFDQLLDPQRVHPPRLTAMSSLVPYYQGTKCGIPEQLKEYYRRSRLVWFAGHGLAHVDHRLLSYDAQEMSIVMSCALAGDPIFVPPYNKWNSDTETICRKHGIELIKFEDGWQHVLHNRYTSLFPKYYLHPYDMNPIQLEDWFER
jgi:hypothetical protein